MIEPTYIGHARYWLQSRNTITVQTSRAIASPAEVIPGVTSPSLTS